MNRSVPGLPVHHHLPEFTQTHVLESVMPSVQHSICQQIWKMQQWPQDWKRSVFIPIPKKDNVNVQTTAQLHLFYMLASESEVAQLCQTLCDTVDCSPPGSSIHGILQTRVLGCHFFLQGNLPDPGMEPWYPALQADALTSEPPLEQYMNQELPDVQTGFRKGRGTRDWIAKIHCKQQENSRKTLLLLHWLC